MAGNDPMTGVLPRVVADGPLDASLSDLLRGSVELLPWRVALEGSRKPVLGVYTYGHPIVDGALLDRLPGLRVISNYGVGVDPIDLAAAAARGIPVGNTPGVLEGTTADLAWADGDAPAGDIRRGSMDRLVQSAIAAVPIAGGAQ